MARMGDHLLPADEAMHPALVRQTSDGDADGGQSQAEDLEWIRNILTTRSFRAADDLVRKYYDDILAYIRAQVGDKEESLNLAQDAFVAILRSLGSYDSHKSSFRTWIHRIATYKVIDYWRIRRRRQRQEAQVFVASGHDQHDDPADQTFKDDLVGRIEDKISQAPVPAQEVLRLHLYAGYGFAQIAEACGEPENTVKARYYRLLDNLRKEFGHESV
ncbi:MAG: sigma-70 family RNA polymerase sigma factor [Bifidobacteriales bacterium]|nr:sigma-70 family RNA polymerase sigma factor [Bifidobacteriales bacterium]